MKEYICTKDSSIFTEGLSYWVAENQYWGGYNVYPTPDDPDSTFARIPLSMLKSDFREVK